MPPSKILVVDDFEPLRRFVCSALERRTEFQVIGQAADGLEAVQKAEELQPDLVLLDISLPKLNGIAVARRIREVSAKSKILFLSEHSSPEIVEAALNTGASGYVIKSDASIELLEAVEIVIQGGRFASRRLARGIFADSEDTRTPDNNVRNERPSLTLPQERQVTHLHEILFCSTEAGFLDSFTKFITPVLNAGNVAIVVATESHRKALFSKLEAGGLDIRYAMEHGNYIALDVAETLSTFMV